MTSKISKKSDKNSLLHDAPLFAGLDNFVLRQTDTTESITVPARKPTAKKTVGRTTQKAATDVKPLPVQRKHIEAPIEATAVLLSVKEICLLLKISRATLIRMDKSGKIPGRIQLGGSVRFHRHTVESWLESLISTHQST